MKNKTSMRKIFLLVSYIISISKFDNCKLYFKNLPKKIRLHKTFSLFMLSVHVNQTITGIKCIKIYSCRKIFKVTV